MDNKGSSIGFMGVLQIVFIVLKLCGIINWSWIWVMSPIWIEFLVIVLVVIWLRR